MLYLDLVGSVKDNPAIKNQKKEAWVQVEFLLKVWAWNEISISSIFDTHSLIRFHFNYCSNKAIFFFFFFVILKSKCIQVCSISKFWISMKFKLQEIC